MDSTMLHVELGNSKVVCERVFADRGNKAEKHNGRDQTCHANKEDCPYYRCDLCCRHILRYHLLPLREQIQNPPIHFEQYEGQDTHSDRQIKLILSSPQLLGRKLNSAVY